MDVARVLLNETCNHRCAFCNARREVERAVVASAGAVRQRIDESRAAGPRTLVLTGGEPTLRRDLPAIIGYAARGGCDVVLETNATRIDTAVAATLARAGLGRARVHTPAWGSDADAITGEPGGFERARAGIGALLGAGIEVELSVPIVAANRDQVAAIPAGVVDANLAIAALVVVVPVQAPDPATLLSTSEVAAAVTDLAEAARSVGLTIRFGLDTFIPPCAFDRSGRVAHMYSMTRGGAERPGYAREPACASCNVADRCPGVSADLRAREPSFQVRPIVEDRMRRRLSIISTVAEQIERELVTREVYRRSDGSVIPSHTVRVNFHCNQACRFCFVSTHLPPADDAAVRAAIVELAEQNGILALSGGEPTLNPKLVDYVALGKERGAREIEIQTNATRFGNSDLASRLHAAGVTDALVSLHGAAAEVSDHVTAAPGTFVKTVAGVDALVETPIRVRLNFVFCQANMSDFPAYVDMVAERWPSVALTISFVASSTDVVPRTEQLMPRYSDVMPYLSRGLAKAREAGLAVSGFESMCGIPLCLVPDDIAAFYGLAEIAEGADGGEFLETEACQQCDLRSRCFGLRRGYADLHGTSELRPIRS